MNTPYFKLLVTFLCVFLTQISFAQLPVCSGQGSGMIYYLNGNKIYNLDPTQPVSTSNPIVNTITPPSGSIGIAVSEPLNVTAPNPTFYVVAGNTYHYYDGTNWVNTGHTAGAVNPGGGGGFLYSLVGGSGAVYRYDGTGNATLATTITGFSSGGPFDLVGDCAGNFYILRTATTQYLRKYSPNGTLLQAWTVSGATSSTFGGGMAIIGNKVYYHNGSGYWEGIMSGNNVAFTQMTPNLSPAPIDFSSCALGGTKTGKISADIDTGYFCSNSPTGVPVKALGTSFTAKINWSVLNGQATISGTGDSVNISATTISQIEMSVTDSNICAITGKDTVTIIPVTATLDAGMYSHVSGCGEFADTLNATLTNKSNGITYNIGWTPVNYVSYPTSNRLTPRVTPPSTTLFTISVTTPQNQGGCIWTDTVTVGVTDKLEDNAAFTYELKAGCKEDTVIFANDTKTIFGPLTYKWAYGDNSIVDTATNPAHIYTNQGIYNVILFANNGLCEDTMSIQLDTRHPLEAIFDIFDARVCTDDTIEFDAGKSIASDPANLKIKWYFGDGDSSNNAHSYHTYRQQGDYYVMLVITDTIPCSDTAIKPIKDVLQAPYIDVGPTDTTLCSDIPLFLPIGISIRGTSYLWSDGSTEARRRIEKPGKYIVQLFNECGVGSDSIIVNHKDCTVWIPNAFSPNGDGLNDIARVSGRNIDDFTEFEFSIYNRKGNRVFYTTDVHKGWDGTYKGVPQPLSTYYYMVRYTFNEEKELLKGDITLVR